MAFDIGSALSGGASLISGISGLFSKAGTTSQEDWKHQKAMAKNQLQWRVQDAEKAGVHPLFALGAPVMSYTGSYGSSPAVGESLERMGAGLSKVAGSVGNRYDDMLRKLALERASLENDLLRSQIRNANQPGRAGSSMAPDQGWDTVTPEVPPAKFTMPGGGQVEVPKGVTPSQIWENFGGDPGDNFGGGLNTLALIHKMLSSTEKEFFKRYLPWLGYTTPYELVGGGSRNYTSRRGYGTGNVKRRKRYYDRIPY